MVVEFLFHWTATKGVVTLFSEDIWCKRGLYNLCRFYDVWCIQKCRNTSVTWYHRICCEQMCQGNKTWMVVLPSNFLHKVPGAKGHQQHPTTITYDMQITHIPYVNKFSSKYVNSPYSHSPKSMPCLITARGTCCSNQGERDTIDFAWPQHDWLVARRVVFLGFVCAHASCTYSDDLFNQWIWYIQ